MHTASLGGGKNAIGAAEALSAFKCWTIEVKKVSITYSNRHALLTYGHKLIDSHTNFSAALARRGA